MATLGSPLVDMGADPIELVGEFLTDRFPTPPMAFGFLIEPEVDMPFDGLPSHKSVNVLTVGALSPEGLYLEPTIGQIWPR